jgi:ADP-ribose pyrophosphatase YjhB (NUDIX family)
MDEPERLPERYWRFVVLTMPIACVDVIVERRSKVLMGFRAIEPYRNVWALPGGRVLKHEHPEDTARRLLEDVRVKAEIRGLVGVFPKRFPRHPQKRYDIPLCYKTEWVAGEPKPNAELIRFRWFNPRKLPDSTGGNYRKMIRHAFM